MPFGDSHVLYITTKVESDQVGIIDRVRKLTL
jgi:hypothetical protein